MDACGRIGFSSDPDFVRNDPDLNLAEAFLQGLLEVHEELCVRLCVVHINKQADIALLVGVTFVDSHAAQRVWKEAHTTEAARKLAVGLEDRLLLDRRVIVIPSG